VQQPGLDGHGDPGDRQRRPGESGGMYL
jgi:hypothetical protein